MAMNNILLIASNPRVNEKIISLVPSLSKYFNIDILLIGEMSPNTNWWGSIDTRKSCIENLKIYTNNIIIGPGFNFHGDRFQNIPEEIFEKTYKFIIFDDNKRMPELHMPYMYKKFKENGSIVIGNSHGNYDFDAIAKELAFGISYDYLYIFGEKERLIFNQLFDSSKLLKGCIPFNDSLKHISKKQKHLLVITNFLGNHHARNEFDQCFNHEYVSNCGIEQIAKKYNLPIVVKQKTRLDDPNYLKNELYIKSLLNCTVISDTENINQLIADSALVITAPSTLAFKPIQLGIPTAITKGTGQIGNFYDFIGLVNANKKEILQTFKDQSELQTNFISTTIEGGENFNSTSCYIDELLKLEQ